MSIEAGILYVVATPIGNLGDLSPRALEVLAGVDLIAAEDTRHSGQLLRHFAITTPLLALHEHNERAICLDLVQRCLAGQAIALISDAGTPLLSDPGYHLISAAHAAGVRVSPVPGPSALLSALSTAGLPTDRFVFEGFLPARGPARRERLGVLATESRTLVFFESPHRLLNALTDMAGVLGEGRPASLARELTKLHETIVHTTLGELRDFVAADPNQQRGESVIVVGGCPDATVHAEGAERTLRILLQELPVKQAVSLAAEISGEKRNTLYKLALKLTDSE